MSSHVTDFNTRKQILTAKLLKQGYRYYKLRKKQGLPELEFYGELVYKFRKIVCRKNFSEQFRKIIIRCTRTGYNLNVMRQTACLVVNAITVGNFAALFNCTPAGRASDSVMAPA